MGTYPADCLNYWRLRHSNPGRNFVFEPSYKHRSNYSGFDTYDGFLTLDDTIIKTGIFTNVMTNRSNKHIKVSNGQTIGMLRTCEEDQIRTIHKIATFIALRLGVDPASNTMTIGKNAPDSSRKRHKSCITSLPGMLKQENWGEHFNEVWTLYCHGH